MQGLLVFDPKCLCLNSSDLALISLLLFITKQSSQEHAPVVSYQHDKSQQRALPKTNVLQNI